ncbi:hypothetical protein llap_16151 [Limosa lapponica baueri]|uniref:Uncharacterized protein n=1 Tax=Limosa lapponica baueri TaxID=1758121 RepID=A0A2I0TIE1_LIMLA|nr:hypothetical protein llap_16151 [Limosa lapponica baueri]
MGKSFIMLFMKTSVAFMDPTFAKHLGWLLPPILMAQNCSCLPLNYSIFCDLGFAFFNFQKEKACKLFSHWSPRVLLLLPVCGNLIDLDVEELLFTACAAHQLLVEHVDKEGGKVEPAGDGGGTRWVEMGLVFAGSFSAVEANSLCAGQEGRRLLVLSHLIPEMGADPILVALALT